MTLTTQSKSLTRLTIDLNFTQVRDLVLQIPDEERKLIYSLLKSEFERKETQWISNEILEGLPEEDDISEEEFYESLKEL